MEPAPTTTRAISVAVRVAARSGVRSDDPVVIRETNNVLVWLRPHPVIAKVAVLPANAELLRREHAVATELADTRLVVPPIAGVDPAIDPDAGFAVTLWPRVEHDADVEIEAERVAGSLRRLHRSLARSTTPLPDFREGIERAGRVLADDGAMALLEPDRRAFLREAFDRIRSDLDGRSVPIHALHGEPHRGNLLATPAGLRWIDLEAVSRGPLEWDLAYAGERVAQHFPDADRELLAVLRRSNSAVVATWCWHRADVADMRTHAEYHLERLRRDLDMEG